MTAPFLSATTLPEAFSQVVARFPDKVAVEFGDDRLTYRQLDARANQLAWRLREHGVDTDTCVALSLERSLDLIVALVAILKAGGAYVPLDAAYPRERLVSMVADTRAKVLVTTQANLPRLPADGLTTLLLDAVTLSDEATEAPPSRALPDTLAYVCFTSGSTGKPKGVGTPHRGVLRTVLGVDYAAFGPDETQLLLAPLSFDASTFEIWGALLHGARLVVMPPRAPSLEELGRAVRESGVTTLWLTTGLFTQVVEHDLEVLRPLKQVLTGGDVASPPHFRRVLETLGIRVVHAYGPTETTVFATCHPMRDASQAGTSVPIGGPIGDTRLYLLDAEGRPTARGEPGELYIGGVGLARGYLEQPGMTAERFVPDAFSGIPGARLYRTGDLVRWREEGVLEFVGRLDAQVKVRGFRIELPEVETAIHVHPSVAEAAVVAHEDTPGEKRLVAYVVPATGQVIEPGALRSAIAEQLPEYMVPSVIVVLEALPLTPQSKVDRKVLAAMKPPVQDAALAPAQKPRGEVEELLAQLFCQVLDLEAVARDADFFALGGHSLSASRLVARVRQTFGVNLPLAALFVSPTVRDLAVEVSKHTRADIAPLPGLVRRPEGSAAQVTPSQERMWFLHQLQPELRAYVHPEAVELRGELDVPALERSLRQMLERHPVLRTPLASQEGRPVPGPRLDVPATVLHVEDLTASADAKARVWRRMEEEISSPFSIEQGPLYRFVLFRLDAQHHVLLLVIHHIVMDGATLGILFEELGVMYQAFRAQQAPALADPEWDAADVAAWQRGPEVKAREEADLAYWKQQLAGAPSRLVLPTDKPRPAALSDRGAVTRRERLSRELTRALDAACQRHHVTPFMALYAAFAVLLQRYSGQDEFCVGTPVSGRTDPAMEQVAGLFINTVVLRTRLDPRASFSDLLEQTRVTALQAFTHQQAPFDRVVDALQVERHIGETPLFQVLFDMYRWEHPLSSAFPGMSAEDLHLAPAASAFDLALFVYKAGEHYDFFFRYRTDLFDDATVERMRVHFLQLLTDAVHAPETPISRLSLLTRAEQHELVRGRPTSTRPFDGATSLATRVLASAARTPDAVALVTPEGSLSFSELTARASRLASHLAALGARPETVVGVCLERSADCVVALLGVHLSGAACLPLEPAHPSARRALILRQSGALLVLSRPALWADEGPGVPLVRVQDASRPGAALATPVEARPENLAYVLYTSGSTGAPKGVELTQRNLVHGLDAFAALYATSPGDCWAATSSVSFDMHMMELLFSLAQGARTVLRHVGPLGLGRDIVEHGITHMVITPSSLAAAFEEPGAPEALRQLSVVVTGGEALPDSLVQQLALTKTLLINSYGPTETTLGVTAKRCTVDTHVNLGQPMERCLLYVLDDALQPTPIGVPGELYIGGEGLGRGYRGRSDLTAERFIPHPFSDIPGARLYRTGDKARWNPDGTLSYLGRTDFQLKVRGVRVELEEIEAALLRLPGVRQAAVVAHSSPPREVTLVAYLLAGPGTDVPSLRRALASSLPDAMVPSHLLLLEALPANSSGKVDRAALASLPLPQVSDANSHQPPRGPVEELLALLFAQVLGVDRVSRHADFFSLGGHSLTATRLVSRLRQSFGVELPLASFFSAPSVEALARVISSHQLARVPPLPEPAHGEGEEPGVPTATQERFWFLHQLQPELRAYHIPEAVELRGPLHLHALDAALRFLLERHASLRSVFVSEEGRPALRLTRIPATVLQVEDAQPHAGEAASLPHARMLEESSRPFSFEHGPLYRFHLFRLGDAHHVLLLVFHHILVDGLSLDVLKRELALAYNALRQNQPPALPPVAHTASDIAAWQRTPEVQAHEDAHLDYWKRQLTGAPSLLTLPTDAPRPAVLSDRGAFSQRHRLSDELARALDAACKQHHVTPFMALYAAFAALLQRYSGQDEFCVGTPVSGRTHPATENVVGLFINTVVLRTRVEPQTSFADLLAQARATALDAFSHQAAPFDRVVDALRVERSLNHTPLVQVLFDLNQNEQTLGSGFSELASRPLLVDNGTSQFDFSLTAVEASGGYAFYLRYNTELFTPATAERMLAHYLRLLERALAQPGLPVAAHSLLSTGERQQVLVDFNAAQPPFDVDATLASLFLASVARTPDAIALVSPEGSLSFSELAARASRLASHLAALGARPESVVGVCLERSADTVIALLAVHLSGAACLPLEPAHPAARRARILRQAGAIFVLSRPALFDGEGPGLPLVEPQDASRPGAALATPVGAGPENLAYVLYTSGSTGAPKGVELTQRNLVHAFEAFDALYATSPGDCWAASSSISFDMHLEELLFSLTRGARVVLRQVGPLGLGRDIDQHGITHIVITPSSLATVFEEPGAPEALRKLSVVVTGGEALPDTLVRQLAFKSTRIVNAYGPTETSVSIALDVCVPHRPVSLGRPMDRCPIFVLDASLQPVPVGVPGELYAGGEGLGRGYRGRSDLTAERFIPHPCSDIPGARLYRTGDKARWNPDGTLSYLGRTDFQLKVRGVRVELEEIEAALLRLPGVRQAAVVTHSAPSREVTLVAYLLAGPGTDVPSLRRALASSLPDAMVPSHLLLLEALPTNSSGKVDRAALASLPLPQVSDADSHQPPRGPVEELLALLFAQVLGVDRVSRHADFFSLGGHSLTATRLVSRLRQSFGVELPLASFFSAPSVEALARVISSHQLARVPPLPSPSPRPHSEPLLPSFSQERLWFLHQLQPELRAYHIPEAVELRGPLHLHALDSALRLLLERHASLRSVFISEEGRPSLHVTPVPPTVLHVEDVTDFPWDRMREEASRTFSLEHGPLYRFHLFRLGDAHHVLLLVFHHILVDGRSFDILLHELALAYSALSQQRTPSLPAFSLNAADISAWQRTPEVRAHEDAHLDYWKHQLRGAPALLTLPLDKPRPQVSAHRGAIQGPLRLAPAATQVLASVCLQHQVTPFMTLYAAFAALLQRYSGQEELCVGTPVSGRTHPATDDVVGLFINTLVLRTRVDTRATFADLLAQVRTTALDAFSHQAVPFERVVDALQIERSLNQTPLFQVLFDLNRTEQALGSSFSELASRPLLVDNHTSQFDLSLSVSESAEGFELFLQYDTELFEPATAERMLTHYLRLLEHALARPGLPVAAHSLLSTEERQQVLVDFNAAQPPFARGATLASLFLDSVARTPDAVALVSPEGSLSFSELAARASRLASHLAALGARPETVVGVCLERSADIVIALLGVHLSGAACLPLEPSHPAARRARILRQAGALFILSRPAFFDDEGPGVPIVEPQDATRPDAALATPVPARPENLAYVLYTSGSTGAPKGVELTQRNLVHALDAYDAHYRPAPGDCWAASSSISFDMHLEELVFSLTRGARVVLRQVGPLGLGRDIVEHGITHIVTTPSSLATAMDEPGGLDAIRRLSVLVTGGEALPDRLVQQLALTKTLLVNSYGPTETTMGVTATLCSVNTPVNLGPPMERCLLYVLDDALQPTPIGVPGELYIGGEGLGRGYRGRSDLTAERFIPHPFSDVPGARLYRTGDKARWNPDGTLSYLGRTDFQLKVRGVRVELEEIEAALLRLPGVRQAAVVTHSAPSREVTLIAYLVSGPGTDVPSLRRALASSLPDAMVPSHLLLLEALPANSSGKVDRAALASLPLPQVSDADSHQPPRGPVEELLALLFAQVLGLDRVSRHADFFSLGGHSLTATRLVSRLRQSFGVELPLASFFSAPSVEALARVISSHQLARVPPLPSPSPRPHSEPLLPSFSQERLWFLHQLQPELRAYHIPEAVELRGPLHLHALDSALRLLLERHASLRSVFISEEGRPSLHVTPVPPTVLHVEDVTDFPWDRMRAEASRTFSLEHGPLYRFHLFRLGDAHHVLLLVFHHILVDGLSLDVLSRELWIAYDALRQHQQPTLTPVAHTAADIASWQRTSQVRAHEEAHLDYWKRQLSGAPSLLALPWDKPRPAVLGDRGAVSQRRHLSKPLSRALDAACQRHQVTPFMALYAAFTALLQRYSGQDELCIGTPVSGRTHPATESVVGLFINTVVLRGRVTHGLSFTELLAQARTTVLEAISHQAAPFERVVQALQVERGLGHSPLVQVLFEMNRADDVQGEVLPGLHAQSLSLDTGTSQFELTLFATEDSSGLAFNIGYNTDLFEAATVERMLGHYLQLLEGALQSPETPVSRLAMLTGDEREAALREARFIDVPPPTTCTHDAFAEQARRVPGRVALSFPGGAWTYRDLSAWTNRAARRLVAQGVTSESLVAVVGPRDEALVRAVLAVHTAGGAHLPLDVRLPPARLAQLLRESQAPFLLVTGGLEQQVEEALRQLPPETRLQRLSLDGCDAERAEPLEHRATPDSLAYVLFTSGSTGVPKGVMVHHGGLHNHIAGMCEGLGVREDDVVAQTAALSFDISVWQMLGALTRGATTHLIPDDVAREPQQLAAELEASGATIVELVPSVLQALLEDTAHAAPAFSRLRCMATIGEALPPAVCRTWFARYPRVPLVNAYGPAECSDTATLHLLREAPEGSSTPIGHPKRGMEVYVLDDAMLPVPPGVVGEIYIGGLGVGRGYRHRPELTAERFVPNPFSREPGARLYRTGDLGRRRTGGALEFVTRADFQVKVRGMRIELAEIEATLSALPSVRACVVTPRERRPGDKELVAWVVPSAPEVQASELRAQLGQYLPAYMVPGRVVLLSTLPLNANGKVDRKALDLRDLPATPDAVEGEPPRGPTEVLIARLFRQALDVEQVSRDDDFFSRGGHSLSATRLVARVRQELGVRLALSAFFANPTVAGLAHAISHAPPAEERAPDVAPPRPEVLPASNVQERLWYALQLPEAPPYVLTLGLVLEGSLRVDALEAALSAVVERNETLRTVFIQERGSLFVRVCPTAQPILASRDVSHLAPGEAEVAAREALSRHDHLRFDVAQGPLYRFELLRMNADGTRHVLLLAVSHLVTDGLGLRAFMGELGAAYRAALAGATPLLAPAPLQYIDVAVSQRGEEARKREDEGLDSWRHALANAPPVLDLPLDFPRRAPALNANMHAVRVCVPTREAEALKDVSRQAGVSRFASVLALMQAWLHRMSGQGHVVVASPFSGRTLPRTEQMVGYFANVLPLCTDVSGNPSFRQLLQRTQAVVAHAAAHQDVPFKRISDALLPEGPRTAPPLAQALLMMEAAGMASLDGLAVSELDVPGVIPAYDVVVSLVEDAHGALEGLVAIDGALFTPASGERMARAFEQLVSAAVRAPDAPLSRLAMLSSQQRAEVLAALDGGPQAIAPGACIHTLFEAQVRRTPRAPAVAHGATTWSYAELNARANLLARRLVEQGLRPEERVGIIMEPSAQAMAVMLGILKAGGAYVPLDATWPEARKRTVVERTGLERLWVDEAVLAEHQGLLPRVEVPPRPDAVPEDLEPGPRAVFDAQLAYIVFTSGSTGEPKGVMVEHRSVVNHNLAIAERFGLRPGDRMLQFAPLTFDAAAEDLYPPLATGGTVVLRSGLVPAHAMTPLLEALDISIISLPPTYIEEWIRQMETMGQRLPARLRLLAPGGDVLKRETYEAWVRVGGGHAPWVNVYGPTECTITSATCDIPGDEGVGSAATFPIGRPIPQVRFYLLDEHLEPVAPGLPGNVYIGGVALSRGYLGAPSPTAERFIPDPFAATPGARMYQTGDLARLQPDGRLRFLGRADHQVKIRGFRIELAEIEACLRRYERVEEAVVVAHGTAAGVQSLCAYVQAPVSEVTPQALREHVVARLPGYMVPASFVVMDALPLNANGKVDRHALPSPEAAAPAPVAPTTPDVETPRMETPFRSTLEMTLHRLWQEVLERPTVTVDDDFFTSGGDSILAMRLLARLEDVFGVPLPLALLFQSSVLKDSVDAIQEFLSEEATPGSIVRLASRGLPDTAVPLFLFHGGDGEVYHYRELVPQLEPHFQCYGVQAPETLAPDRPLPDFDARVAAYTRDVRAIQPQGPYRLLGFSFGGYPAIGVAAALEAQGEKVELLAVVDTLTSEIIRATMPAQHLEPVLAISEVFGVFDAQLPDELAPLSPEAQWERVAERARATGLASPHFSGKDLARVGRVLAEVLTPQAAAWKVQAPKSVRPLLIRSAATLAEFGNETFGWEQHLPREQLDLVTLPGGHATLIRPPVVEELAQRLIALLPK